jgi:hypothetical protein
MSRCGRKRPAPHLLNDTIRPGNPPMLASHVDNRNLASDASSAAGDSQAAALLNRVLRVLEAYRHMPLSFEIDGAGVAAAVLESTAEIGLAARLALPDRSIAACAACRRAMHLALAQPVEGEGDEAPGDMVRGSVASALDGVPLAGPTAPAMTDEALPLAAWVQWLWQSVRVIDSEALEMIRLRAAGHTHREIADQLGLGVRLVGRVIADARRVCGEGGEP